MAVARVAGSVINSMCIDPLMYNKNQIDDDDRCAYMTDIPYKMSPPINICQPNVHFNDKNSQIMLKLVDKNDRTVIRIVGLCNNKTKLELSNHNCAEAKNVPDSTDKQMTKFLLRKLSNKVAIHNEYCNTQLTYNIKKYRKIVDVKVDKINKKGRVIGKKTMK